MIDRKRKYYTFNIILYRDSLDYDYDKIIKYIVQNWSQYGYIEHQPEKDQKKVHTHVLVHFPNKRYINAISKEIGVKDNYIQPSNLIPFLRYLIHYDDEDKIQYSPYEVVGPLQEKLLEVIKSNKSETQQVSMILDYIFEYKGTLHYCTLSQFVVQNGLYSAYRRNYSFFKDLVLEHNKYI